ncbi:MAG: alpha-mannosidase, partial [Acidimicrobiales bacterium]
VRYFLTQKLSWNETNAFPHHTFLWEGIDGSRVLAHCPPTDTYNGDFHVPQLLGGERSFAQHGVSRHSLYPYGYGDGGGGPTKAMLDRYRRLRDLDPLPRIELGTGRGFFEAVQAEASRAEEVSGRANEGTVTTAHGPGPGGLPVWVGELYLERHRGVQTTQARSKLGNRRCENLLREAELWTAAAFDGEEADEAAALLERAWQTVLLHQFHDILPGSSIHWVHDDSRRAYADVEDLLGGLIARSIARLAGRPSRFADSAPADSTPTGEALAPEVATGDELGTVVLFNAATDDRRGIVELDLDDLGLSGEPTTAVSQHGEELAVQQTSGSRLILCAAAPGSGWSSYKLKRTRRADQGEPAARALDVRTLTNGLVTLAMDENGFVTSLFDHMHEREAIARGQRANAFQLHRDLPNDADAWDVDPGTFDRAEEISALNEEEIVEEGPIRASIRHVRRFGDSVITQEIRLAAQSRRVEFITELEWSERHRFLKVAFPLQVRASHATFEVQFGHVERPTHANTSWDAAKFEVPAQRWADLSEPGFGVALLNDCKHGYDVRSNVMRLSLLRGPTWPDPRADLGRHRFSYAVLPHGSLSEKGLVAHEAEAFNLPIRAVSSNPAAGPASGRVLEVRGAAVSSIKRADSGDWLAVRLYEHLGTHSRAELVLGGAGIKDARRADSLERAAGPVDVEAGKARLDLRPFELVTVLLSS